MVSEGDPAPEFELPNQDGEPVALSAFEGERVVLYFYPKADTPGCTIEAERFRDRHGEFTDADAVVLGVSMDTIEEIAAFHGKYDLGFDLLADPDGEVTRAYDSYGTLDHEGETYEIANRNTFVIGPDGHIERAYRGVDPDGHTADVLADL